MIETARDLVIEQLARLRMACAAIGDRGIHPSAIRLDDLDEEVADAFRRQAKKDYDVLLTDSIGNSTAGGKPDIRDRT